MKNHNIKGESFTTQQLHLHTPGCTVATAKLIFYFPNVNICYLISIVITIA